jgi:hypothetical protein
MEGFLLGSILGFMELSFVGTKEFFGDGTIDGSFEGLTLCSKEGSILDTALGFSEFSEVGMIE